MPRDFDVVLSGSDGFFGSESTEFIPIDDSENPYMRIVDLELVETEDQPTVTPAEQT